MAKLMSEEEKAMLQKEFKRLKRQMNISRSIEILKRSLKELNK